jgi:CheY-like chemotaxis protein
MPTRVLAFESDTQFARELESGFRSLGCEVTVVDDVNSGLQAASANKPDLILLTIELPRMSGYSVCNRIKRDADLKDIPLIIMSSESTDQTFEQHRRLATRAQDYVRKPIGFSNLLERAKNFVELRSASLAPDDDGIVIDDEIEIQEDGSKPSASKSVSPSLRPIDADIDDFAEQAFGAMIGNTGAPPSGSEPAVPSALPSSPRVPSNLSVNVDSQPNVVTLDQELANAELERIRSLLEEKDTQLAEALGEVRELKRASRVAQNDATETEELKRELQELKAKLNTLTTPSAAPSAKPSIGPSAREFLDLREQLNKKDKELLDLRDQITHKEKDLLNLRDATLAHERDKADLSDKLDEITRQFADLQKISDAARNDKEAAAKRADDFKRKSEKFAGLLEEKTAELDRSAAKYASDLSEKDSERERLIADHASAFEQARAERVAALAEAQEQGARATERAVLEARSAAEEHERQALETLREASVAQRDAALSEMDQRLRSEYATDKAHALSEQERTLRAEHASDKAHALDELRGEKERSERALESRIQIFEKELEIRLGELAKSREDCQHRDENITRLEGSLDSLRREMEEANRVLNGREVAITNLQSELAQQRNETTEALDALSAERRRLKAASEKWNEDRANLEKVKDALAVALLQVEAIESRTLE